MMDRELRARLENWIQEVDGPSTERGAAGAPAPDELKDYADLWLELGSVAKAEPDPRALLRGREAMLAALFKRSGSSRVPARILSGPVVARGFAVVLAAVLLAVGAAGTSAALGGPDLAGNAISAISSTRDKTPDAANRGLDRAEEAINQGRGAPEGLQENGPQDGSQGLDRARENVPPHAQPGLDQAESAPGDGPDAADEKANEAAEHGLNTAGSTPAGQGDTPAGSNTGLDTAQDHAAPGAQDGLDTASDAAGNGSLPPEAQQGMENAEGARPLFGPGF